MKKKHVTPAALAVILLASASVAFGSILGTAGNFTVLGGTAITSTGTVGTVIKNGNVGVSPAATTAITGFPPAVIENGAIVPTGAVTAKARQDLIKAQVGIAAMPSNVNLGTSDLAGKVLAPGVYTFNAAATLTGTVILDGQGKNGAFWVFQIGTTLTTSLAASVTIINPGSNGGSDYGIFWNCGSAINIAANNQIAGVYLSGTSINFGVNSTRGGRALALAAISLDNNQIDARGGPGGGDYSGGLAFDKSGKVVSIAIVNAPPTFKYFGKSKRTSHRIGFLVKGTASTSATQIQWCLKNGKWHSVSVQKNNRWQLRVKGLRPGKNRVSLRARNIAGKFSAVRALRITRR